MDNILSWVKAVLAVTPETWRRLTHDLPPELLTTPPAQGQWSALDCLQHLIDTERVFHFRLGCVLEGKDFPAFNPDTQGKAPDRSRTPADIAEEFAGLRAENLKALAGIGASRAGPLGPPPGAGDGHPERDGARVGGPRPQPHGPGGTGDDAALHPRLRALAALLRGPPHPAELKTTSHGPRRRFSTEWY